MVLAEKLLEMPGSLLKSLSPQVGFVEAKALGSAA
jgi:hypothetical protein